MGEQAAECQYSGKATLLRAAFLCACSCLFLQVVKQPHFFLFVCPILSLQSSQILGEHQRNS